VLSKFSVMPHSAFNIISLFPYNKLNAIKLKQRLIKCEGLILYQQMHVMHTTISSSRYARSGREIGLFKINYC